LLGLLATHGRPDDGLASLGRDPWHVLEGNAELRRGGHGAGGGRDADGPDERRNESSWWTCSMRAGWLPTTRKVCGTPLGSTT
jgi:hypothetical protein